MNHPPSAYKELLVQLADSRKRAAELEEMLTAATDVAVQRGKRIDELERDRDDWRDAYREEMISPSDW